MIKVSIIALSILSFTFSFAQQNNVLLIIVDDLGVDPVLGFMPEALQKANTPIIDSLRESGVTFSKAWTNPICSPTRSAIITGKYGFRTGVLNATNLALIDPYEQILHNYLNQESDGELSSSIIGKWHLGGDASSEYPMFMGVPHYAGIMSGAVSDYEDWTYTENGIGTNSLEYTTTKLTDEAIDWINLQDQSWFCWLAYNAPHTPFHLPPADLHTSDGLVDDDVIIENDPLPYYLAMVESLDTEIGRLISEIPEDELAYTTIIFIGDNGSPGQVAQSPYNTNRAKGSLFQGGIHVPLIVSGNQVSRENEIDSSLIVSSDLFCTISELAGYELNEYEDSFSFKSLLTEENTGQRDCSFTDIQDGQKGYGWSARDERFKYTIWDSVPERFYDLWVDPFELNGLLNGMGNLTSEEQDAFDKLSQVRETLSIEERSIETFEMYPNPVESILNVVSSLKNESIYIYDFSGRVMLKSASHSKIDVSFLQSGVYFIQTGTTIHQLVKQ